MLTSIKRSQLILGLAFASLLVSGLLSATLLKKDADLNDLGFVNQDGLQFNLSDLNGKPVILNYVFTGCSVYCPVQVGSLRVMQMRLNERFGADNYQLLSVTLTPETDTPNDMKHYAERFSVNLENWHFATGSESNIEALIKATKAKVVKWGDEYELDHTTFVYLINDKGELGYRFEGIPLDKTSLLSALETEISTL